jgi:GAF domain-containing protein/anti-sigma regulatory factor (Ser/Thr protein kinase)
LRKEEAFLGYIIASRREVRPFSDKQISLLQNFAAQAVIAMENARLITETREALEQQTATAEVLGVINSSPGDLAPVFDAMLDSAMRLCGAAFGMMSITEGDRARIAAVRGLPPAFAEFRRHNPNPATPGTVAARILRGEPFVHTADLRDDDLYRDGDPQRRAIVDLGGVRTSLVVALRRDRDVLGAIHIYRQEVRPFSDSQIALLQNFAAQAVIAMENARLITETREALEQQTATAEVLGVINSSPGEVAPVFEAILEKAHGLCGAAKGSLVTFDGEHFRTAATRGFSEEYAALLRESQHNQPGSPPQRLLDGETLVEIPDVGVLPFAIPMAAAEREGARTVLYVPLRKDAALLGYITAYRQEVRPFSDKQIALLQNFAAQAVIAMENARLITETREALEQQTATAEVLGVINSSPGDLAPVFEAMLEKAMRLCEAAHSHFLIYDGEVFHPAAVHGEPDFEEFWRRGGPVRPSHPANPLAQLARGARLVHVADARQEDAYRDVPAYRQLIDLGGIRTSLTVPLRKEGVLLGALRVYRKEVRPFSDKQIALVENFAAQAVIAMENARLITETREALEQQTATAEVLGVINSSPGDLAPVFDAILEKAHTLCEAAHGALMVYDGQHFRAVAVRGVPEPLAERLQGFRTGPKHPVWPLLDGASFVHIADLTEFDHPEELRVGIELGSRTLLFVALRKDGALLGQIVAVRREVRPFSDKQIALLQNFAAQAVIAMENARLITETREALKQQTATAEVLQVINSSPGDLAPVFDAMLEKAMRLCEAAFGTLWTLSGDRFQPVTHRGVPEPYAEYLARDVPAAGPGTGRARLLAGEHLVHTADLADEEPYRTGEPHRRALVDLGGARTGLIVPLRKDSAVIGFIMIYRQEVRPFSDKEIALLQNFAAQAVIAMENARLITETRESLEYQTATSDVLKVISQSAFDLDAVLEAVVAAAIRLCRADFAAIYRNEDGEYRWAVGGGNRQEPSYSIEYERIERSVRIRPGTGTLVGRTALEGRTVQIPDVLNDPLYEAKDDARIGNARTMLGVPLLRENAPIGVIGLVRLRVEAFSEREIQLVTTFADQAVIAIENARLFNELRARTAELGRSVEELKMLSEVGRAVSSTLDLRAVLSTILTSSLGLTWANAGAIFRYSRAERAFRLVEAVGWDEALARSVRDLRVAETESAMGEAVARRTPIQLPDIAQRPSPLRDLTLAAGFHSALIVPLVGAERTLGAIILMRQEAGEFPPETVRLMQTLASQSALAIQNARLFREIADKSEQLALASQHKSQFLANMSHELRTPLNAILGYAELLVDGIYGQLSDRPKGVLERIQNNGKHLLALINDVLDLAKIEAGQLTLTIEDYSLPEVVRSVVTATEPLATGKGLKFIAALQDNLPMAHGDARRVSQVLLNLVGNAIKFTDQGEVEIRAAAEKGQFVLTVRDTGPGIPDADQERIFGEFQQIDNSNTRKQGGTGLGLAISKRMVEIQGGTISVDSVLGQGSTFRVILPVHVDEVMEAA